jgi:hypothetical protein
MALLIDHPSDVALRDVTNFVPDDTGQSTLALRGND